MMSIALVLVEAETKDSHVWFLELLVNNLGGPQVAKHFTFMSGQQKVYFLITLPKLLTVTNITYA